MNRWQASRTMSNVTPFQCLPKHATFHVMQRRGSHLLVPPHQCTNPTMANVSLLYINIQVLSNERKTYLMNNNQAAQLDASGQIKINVSASSLTFMNRAFAIVTFLIFASPILIKTQTEHQPELGPIAKHQCTQGSICTGFGLCWRTLSGVNIHISVSWFEANGFKSLRVSCRSLR